MRLQCCKKCQFRRCLARDAAAAWFAQSTCSQQHMWLLTSLCHSVALVSSKMMQTLSLAQLLLMFASHHYSCLLSAQTAPLKWSAVCAALICSAPLPCQTRYPCTWQQWLEHVQQESKCSLRCAMQRNHRDRRALHCHLLWSKRHCLLGKPGWGMQL